MKLPEHCSVVDVAATEETVLLVQSCLSNGNDLVDIDPSAEVGEL